MGKRQFCGFAPGLFVHAPPAVMRGDDERHEAGLPVVGDEDDLHGKQVVSLWFEAARRGWRGTFSPKGAIVGSTSGASQAAHEKRAKRKRLSK